MSDDSRLALLVEEAIDGTRSVAVDEAQEAAYLRHRRLAVLLQAEARSRLGHGTAATIAGLIGSQASSRRAAMVRAIRPRLRPRRRGLGWSSLVCAAGLVLTVGAWLLSTPPRDRAGLTVLACTGMPGLSPGQRLSFPDRLMLPAGATASLGLADGSLIELEGPADLAPEQPGSGLALHLAEGTARVEAKPQPVEAPLRVRSPHATLTVIGTNFTLRVSAAGSRLQVTEGTVRFAPDDGAERMIASGAEAWAWPRPQLSADFEDGLMPAAPPRWSGRLVPGPARPGNHWCLEGVLYSEEFQSFGIMIDDWSEQRPGLFAYRAGLHLRCRLWIAPGPGRWELLVGNEGPDGDYHRGLDDLPRGRWTDLEVDLATLPPWHEDKPRSRRLTEGTWVRDLRFQADDQPGLAIYIDDVELYTPNGDLP